MAPLIEKCRTIVARIQDGSAQLANGGWTRVTDINPDDKVALGEIRDTFNDMYKNG